MPSAKEALQTRQEAGEPLEFLFFWGHTAPASGQLGPHVLSQWFEAPFTVAGHTYATAEHWMMAEKARFFGDDAMVPQILAASSPGAAKALGRRVKDFDNEAWERVRSAIVRTGNVEKFRQNPALAGWLVATGSVVLVEASPRDAIWGIGMGASNPDCRQVARWRGENLLGFALMEARDRLRMHREPPATMMPLPWERSPGVHPASIAWRMGSGESYLVELAAWWEGLTPDERVAVELLHPATGAWAGWYDPVG